jgi:hypothetical protein
MRVRHVHMFAPFEPADPLEHDREKHVPEKAGVDTGFPEKSCENKESHDLGGARSRAWNVDDAMDLGCNFDALLSIASRQVSSARPAPAVARLHQIPAARQRLST